MMGSVHSINDGRTIDPPAGGGDNGGMEARITRLETVAEFMQRDIAELKQDIAATRKEVHSIRTTDFRLLFGAIITVTLGLAGLMAKGFGWL